MRFNNGGSLMRSSSLGPAAIAARVKYIRDINLGIPQSRFLGAYLMNRGGSLGCCGLGAYGDIGDTGAYLSGNTSPATILGPIAVRMINLRKKGLSPEAALLDAIASLSNQGMKTLTPAMHLQLAAGLQKLPAGGLSGYQMGNPSFYEKSPPPYMGALGLAPVVGAGVTGGSLAASSVGVGAATALGIGSGIALGQTVIPIPVVGAVIGAIVFEAAHLMQRHVGKAEAAWANQGFYNSLRTMNGRDYDEKQFSEAFKGMMDTGNNIVPGCGPDRHKNPDCLLGPMAAVIAQGYLSRAVPLSATTAQVFQTVVKPWLMSGAGGLVNGRTLAAEPIQLLMMQAATDRYLAGQAMTRGDMPGYGSQGAHTPTLVQALQPILAQPTTTTPQQPPSNAGGPQYLPAIPPRVNVQDPTAGGSPPIMVPVGGGGMVTLPQQALPSYPSYSPPGGVGPAIGTPMLPGQPPGYNAPGMPIQAAGIGGGLPTWVTLGLAALGIGMVIFKQGPVKSPPTVS